MSVVRSPVSNSRPGAPGIVPISSSRMLSSFLSSGPSTALHTVLSSAGRMRWLRFVVSHPFARERRMDGAGRIEILVASFNCLPSR